MSFRFISGALLAALLLDRAFAADPAPDAAPPTAPQLTIPALWWRSLASTPDGQVAYWDTAKLRAVGANWVSTSYRPLDANQVYVGTSWVMPPPLLARVMELAKPGLKIAHAAGVQVVGTTDSLQFHPAVMQAAGIDPEQLHARDHAGRPVGFDAYQKGNQLSCLQNPHWQEIEAGIGRAHAQAGFDGLFLDLFPYIVKEGALCACEHCRHGWAAYAEKTLGGTRAFPTGALHLDRVTDRVFLTWRIEAIHAFMEKIQSAGREYNPAFRVLLNCNADNPCMAYLLLQGMPQPTSELGQINAGEESTLYLHRMIEAAGGDPLFAQFNGQRQYLPEYKYKTALAEAFAAGGALMLPARNDAMDDINRGFTDFLQANRPAFAGSRSDAAVGILFSWRDHTFLQSDPVIRTDRMVWNRNAARRSAALLAAKGIAYDYVLVEKGLSLAGLKQYDVLVAPELKLLDDRDADILRQFVAQGGKLLALGGFGTLRPEGVEYRPVAAARLNAWIGEAAAQGDLRGAVGRGKVASVRAYASGSTEASLRPSADWEQAAEFLGVDAQLKVRAKGRGHIETTLRQNGRIRYLHLIRYACGGEPGQAGVAIDYRIPAGQKIAAITAVSPYSADPKPIVQWQAADGRAQLATSVGVYTLLRIELAP
jgi:hypothetical protein